MCTNNQKEKYVILEVIGSGEVFNNVSLYNKFGADVKRFG